MVKGAGSWGCRARVPQIPGGWRGAWPSAPRKEPDAALSSNPLSPQIPIAVSGVRGMGFLMKYHIETGGGQLPAKLSSLFIKVSKGSGLGAGPLNREHRR